MGVVGLVVAALVSVSACGVSSAPEQKSGGSPGLSAKAAADLCSAALAGDSAAQAVRPSPAPSTVIRCRTDITVASPTLEWQVSRSTGSLSGLVDDLRRPDVVDSGVQVCAAIAMPEYQYLGVTESGAVSVLRVPRAHCGAVYPTDESVAAAGFEDLGTFHMELRP